MKKRMDGMTRAARAALTVGTMVALAGSSLPGDAAAQAAADGRYGSSILALLPVVEEVRIGTTVEGTLSASDFETVSGVRVRAYELHGSRGDPVTIDMMSDDLDAYLYLVGPGYEEPFTDDDSGGACNARLNAFLPEDGPYLLVVGSLGGEGGAYTLRVDNRGHPVADGDCFGAEGEYFEELEASLMALDVEGTLEIGVPVDGTLSEDVTLEDGSPAQAWWYLGVPGDVVTFDLLSDDFDAMLFVVEEEGPGFLSDDDGAGGCNSRVELEVESSEPYRVVVSSISGSGAFTLRLSEDPPPPSGESCMGL